MQVVVSAAAGLEQLKEIEHFIEGLRQLKSCLEKCCNFINQFTSSNRWYKYVIKTYSYSNEFTNLTESLEKSATLLQLGLNAQHLFNRESDKEDQQLDIEDLRSRQGEIFKLNQEAFKVLIHLDIEQEKRFVLLQKQVSSLKENLEYLTRQSLNREGPITAPSHFDTSLNIPFYELEFKKAISSGLNCNVYTGQWSSTEAAFKVLEGEFTEDEHIRFVREIKVMSELRHPNIVPLYGACSEHGRKCLIMPYYHNRDLSTFVNNIKTSVYPTDTGHSAKSCRNSSTSTISKLLKPIENSEHLGVLGISPVLKCSLSIDILKGLSYLHQRGIIHRNLNSSHIYVNKTNQAFVGGVGLCKISSINIQTAKLSPTEMTFSSIWQAPELSERGQTATLQSDIYSVGLILWELWTEQTVFDVFGLELSKEVSLKSNSANNVNRSYPVTPCTPSIKDKPPKTNTRLEVELQMIRSKQLPLDGVPKELQDIVSNCLGDAGSRPTTDALLSKIKNYRASLINSAQENYDKALKLEQSGQYKEALVLYQTGCEQGYAKAYTNLGFFHLKGTANIFCKNKTKAAEFFKIAAEKGHVRAMMNLGMMLEYGDGIPRDISTATHWYKRAMDLGDRNAKERYEKLKKKNKEKEYQTNLNSLEHH